MKKILGKAVLSAALLSAMPQVAHARLINPVADRTVPPVAAFEPGHLPFAINLRDDLVVDPETFAVFAQPGRSEERRDGHGSRYLGTRAAHRTHKVRG